MKFIKKYDWMFRRMLASIPVSDIARKTFKDWWKQLGQIVDANLELALTEADKQFEKEIKELQKRNDNLQKLYSIEHKLKKPSIRESQAVEKMSEIATELANTYLTISELKQQLKDKHFIEKKKLIEED